MTETLTVIATTAKTPEARDDRAAHRRNRRRMEATSVVELYASDDARMELYRVRLAIVISHLAALRKAVGHALDLPVELYPLAPDGSGMNDWYGPNDELQWMAGTLRRFEEAIESWGVNGCSRSDLTARTIGDRLRRD